MQKKKKGSASHLYSLQEGCLCYQAEPAVEESRFCYIDCMTPVHRKQVDGNEKQFGPQLSTLRSNPHPVPGAAQE